VSKLKLSTFERTKTMLIVSMESRSSTS